MPVEQLTNGIEMIIILILIEYSNCLTVQITIRFV